MLEAREPQGGGGTQAGDAFQVQRSLWRESLHSYPPSDASENPGTETDEAQDSDA